MGTVTSVEKYYEDARKMLEKKDLAGFMESIGSAKVLAGADKNLLAKVTFLKVKGLYSFNQYKKALEGIPEALKYNSGEEVSQLEYYKGIIFGYRGEFVKAVSIFKNLLGKTKDIHLKVKIYLSISWVYITLDKSNLKEKLEDAKKYIDSANGYFDILPDKLKRKICNNYSVYFFYKEEYEKAIEILKKSIEYSEEKDLANIYYNLAEIYLSAYENEDLILAKEYLKKAELIGMEFNDNLSLGNTFFAKATIELREDQFFSALDTLYLSFEYFKNAEAYSYAFDCLVKINELMSEYKIDSLNSIKESFKNKLKGTAFYEKI